MPRKLPELISVVVLYRLALTLLWPVLVARALWLWLRGREDRLSVRDRIFGPRPAKGVIWLHGASNGELTAARPLIDALLASHPDRLILVTANTLTGRDLVAGWQQPGIQAAIAPFDSRWAVTATLRTVSAYLSLENELWPNRIIACHQTKTPVLLMSARLSANSAERWQNFPKLAAALLHPVAYIAPQDTETAARFVELGATPGEPFSLKASYQPDTTPIPEAILDQFTRSKTLLAASTHDGEDDIILKAFAPLHAADPSLRLIIAPRHLKRVADIEAAARALDLATCRRSQSETRAPVFIADSMGEMPMWYQLAAVTFVGGSLIPNGGGHTPFEPASYGSAILHGPNFSNHINAYTQLAQINGAQQITDAATLQAAFAKHLTNSPLPENARTILNPDGLARLVNKIETFLPQSDVIKVDP